MSFLSYRNGAPAADDGLLERLFEVAAHPGAQPQHEYAQDVKTDRQLGILIGELVGFSDKGYPLVVLPAFNAQRPITARTIVAVEPSHCGCEVAVTFENGDRDRPLIVGTIQGPKETAPIDSRLSEQRADKDRLVFRADREVVIECGKASITLTSSGKILIRGAYVLSRSSGVNRLKGASVQIN